MHTSLEHFADWSGVEGVSASPQESLVALRGYRADMYRRRAAVAGATSEQGRPYLLVVPEADELLAGLPAEQRRTAGGMLWEVTRTGRATQHWQVLGLRNYELMGQTIPGVARDCIGTRIYTSTEQHRPGPLVIDIAATTATGQVNWIPDPGSSTAADTAILSKLKQLVAEAQQGAGAS